jgi:hypothetical protein
MYVIAGRATRTPSTRANDTQTVSDEPSVNSHTGDMGAPPGSSPSHGSDIRHDEEDDAAPAAGNDDDDMEEHKDDGEDFLGEDI